MDLLHTCKPVQQHVLVWGKDSQKVEAAINHLFLEFSEHLYPFSISEIPTLIDSINKLELEIELEKYNFHFLKIYNDSLELIMVDNTKFNIKISDFEEDLEVIARNIVQYKIQQMLLQLKERKPLKFTF